MTGWTQAAGGAFSKFAANTAGNPYLKRVWVWVTSQSRRDRGFATVSGSLFSYVRAPARMIFALALTIILGGLAIWTWSEFSVFRSDAETIVSATALTMDDIARNSLDRVDGVLETVVGRIEEKGIDNINSEAERAALKLLTRPLPETGMIVLANSDGNIVAAVPPLQSPLNGATANGLEA